MLRRRLLRNFGAFYRFDRWLRRHLTAAGYLALSTLGVAAVMGVNTRLNLASRIFALLLSLLLVSTLSSLYFRPKLRVRRMLPPCATALQPVRYRLRIENHGRREQRGLALSDELCDALPSYEEFIHCRDPADRHRNAFDRYVGYPRWLWLIGQKRGADDPTVVLPPLAPGAGVEIELELLPRRRGYLHFQGCRIARPDPLGMINALHRIPAPGTLLVLPKRYPVAPLRLAGRRLYHPGGIALAGSSGDSEEFVALRDYRPGDPLRTIHWKSWARTGRPIVIETRAEYFARHALILDTFVTPESEVLFEEAVSVAASVLAAFDTREALLDLLLVGPQAYCFTAGRGLDSSAYLLKILACARGAAEYPFATLHQSVLHYAAHLSGCIAVLLAWDAERRNLVRTLRRRGIQTLALVVTPGADNTVREDEGCIALPSGRIAQSLSALCPSPRDY